MIRFYTNRELAEKLEINLARWKRWSREFLPPDPLGGMQSGFARQYNPDDGFKVFLCGHLVAELKFSIPDARIVLSDLRGWLKECGFYFISANNNNLKPDYKKKMVVRYIIYIKKSAHWPDKNDTGFSYSIKGLISKKQVQYKGIDIVEECYTEDNMGLPFKKPSAPENGSVKLLNITDLLHIFANRLGLKKYNFPALSLIE